MKTSESGKTLKLRKVLIANRGEIVVRVARACDALGIATVAVYSDADAGAVHVGACAQAVRLGPPPPRESYLNVEALLEAARQTGADAVHPGYGFLSENAAFAEAVAAAGLVFIGPSPHAIRTMGSKTAARAAMEHSGVPVVPGYQAGGEPEDFAKAAAALGYPVLVKAAAGGGGKGMRVVHEAARRGADRATGLDREGAPVDVDDRATATERDVHEAPAALDHATGFITGLERDRGEEDAAREIGGVDRVAIGIGGDRGLSVGQDDERPAGDGWRRRCGGDGGAEVGVDAGPLLAHAARAAVAAHAVA
ncbi:MAG: biotin carboxylase N-terminal domain-containing protein [Deltaproteobacteria bacterium]